VLGPAFRPSAHTRHRLLDALALHDVQPSLDPSRALRTYHSTYPTLTLRRAQAVAVVTGVVGTSALMYFTNQRTKAVDAPASIYSPSSPALLPRTAHSRASRRRGRPSRAVSTTRLVRRARDRRAHDVRRRPAARLRRWKARPEKLSAKCAVRARLPLSVSPTRAAANWMPFRAKVMLVLYPPRLFRAHTSAHLLQSGRSKAQRICMIRDIRPSTFQSSKLQATQPVSRAGRRPLRRRAQLSSASALPTRPTSRLEY
jgi:hypothetical protein